MDVDTVDGLAHHYRASTAAMDGVGVQANTNVIEGQLGLEVSCPSHSASGVAVQAAPVRKRAEPL